MGVYFPSLTVGWPTCAVCSRILGKAVIQPHFAGTLQIPSQRLVHAPGHNPDVDQAETSRCGPVVPRGTIRATWTRSLLRNSVTLSIVFASRPASSTWLGPLLAHTHTHECTGRFIEGMACHPATSELALKFPLHLRHLAGLWKFYWPVAQHPSSRGTGRCSRAEFHHRLPAKSANKSASDGELERIACTFKRYQAS